MPKVDDPREETLSSLDDRLDALEARRAAATSSRFSAEKASSDGYRVLADLIGGVLGGLGLGWLLDHFAGTGPFGMIGGLLIGSGFSVYVIVRKAGRPPSGTKAAKLPAASVPTADEDDDPPGVFGPRQGDD